MLKNTQTTIFILKLFVHLPPWTDSHLKTEKVSLLCAHVQRRAPPQVHGADLGSVGQEVLQDQVVVADSCYLESRLGRRDTPIIRLMGQNAHKEEGNAIFPTWPLCSLMSREPNPAIFAASTYARARLPCATAIWRNLQRENTQVRLWFLKAI